MTHVKKLALAAALAATTATAGELVVGKQVNITGTILCDTFEQLDEILTAQIDSFESARSVYLRLYGEKNEAGKPKCLYVSPPRHFSVITVKSVKDYNVVWPSGNRTDLSAIAVLWYDPNDNEYTGFIFSDWDVVHPKDPIKPVKGEPV